MKDHKKLLRPLMAGVLGLAMVFSVILFTVMADAEPYVQIGGGEILRAADGSYQLLVDVSVGNVPGSGMLSSFTGYLEYDSRYLVPSAWADNSEIDKNSNGNSSFKIDPSLVYEHNGVETIPFYLNAWAAGSGSSTVVGLQSQVISLFWSMNPVQYDFDTPMLGTVKIRGEEERNPYIKAKGKAQVPLGKLSFKIVNPETMLPKIIEVFYDLKSAGWDAEEGKVDVKAGNAHNGEYLVRIRGEGENGGITSDPCFQILDYELQPGSNEVEEYHDPVLHNPKRNVVWNFDPDSLMSAESARKDVVINAYQAFGNGTPLDLADALVRYSPTVRGQHVSGEFEDFPIHWAAEECVVSQVTGGAETVVGTLKRTKDGNGDFDGGYTFLDPAGDPVSDNWYDPTGGEYNLVQKFTYTSTQGHVSSFDIKVHLTVTPVTVTGLTAEGLTGTYLNNQYLPATRSKLGLPGEALLTTDVTPGLVSLTMPIKGWQFPVGTNIANDLSNLDGLAPDGTTPVTWTDKDNRIGDYELRAVATLDPAAPADRVKYTREVIQAVYPWLTVTDEYELKATRRIVDVSETVPEFELEYVSTGNDGELTLRMRKLVDGNPVSMEENDSFRLKLPGGSVVTGPATNAVDGYDFSWTAYDDGGIRCYDLHLKGSSTGSRARLIQSSVNLGGWFEAEVTEPNAATPGGTKTSDFVPAFVPARPNLYTATKVFNFRGDKAKLYPFYKNQKTLPNFITLPLGSDYTVPTTYDGLTGTEPGTLNAFAVNGWPDGTEATWNGTVWTSTDDPIKVGFGPQNYADYTYTAFGEVVNPSRYTATMLVEVQDKEKPVLQEGVTLTYEGVGDAVIPEKTDLGRLLRIIFDTQQVDYKYRQTVTLTLTNHGDKEINGIYIDNTGTAGCEGEFIITRQPSPKLPAHASTTFDVTYVMNLPVGKHQAINNDLATPPLEPLKIYSDQGLLKEFEAVYEVTPGPVYRLRIEVTPSDYSRGTALAVQGLDSDTPPGLDETPVPYTYMEGDTAWVLAKPLNKFAVQEVYYYNDNGIKTPLSQYPGLTMTDGKMLTNVTMPDHDLTVYVVFDEPLRDKLRLLDLQGWSAPTVDYMKVTPGLDNAGHQLPLRLHKTDTAETADYKIVRDSADYVYDQSISVPSNLDTYNGWDVLQKPDDVYQLDESTYLVVIDVDDAQSQVRLQLREVAGDIEPSITITYGYGLELGAYSYTTPAGTQAQMRHISTIFNSPPQGQRMTATITLTASNEAEGTVSREYKLIFARRSPDEPTYPMTAGNSPYGMIEWDSALTDKAQAKADYVKDNRFTNSSRPVKAADLNKVYWPEAWDGKINYDRVDEALFVFAGEAFEDFGPKEGKVTNTAGDIVANKDITRSLTVVLRDNAGGEQKTDFEGTTTQDLDFNAASAATADVTMIPASVWADYRVRPGVYELKYTYTDFDGTATVVFSRPLIVLGRLGDVDLAAPVDGADADKVEARVSAPLGYEATGYAYGQLFALRVCDANNDRNINNIDANTIRGIGGRPHLPEFYLPVGYSSNP